MTNTNDYRPRLAAEIRPDQADRLKEILPHGLQKPLMQAIVDGIIELYDKGGLEALAAISTKYISLTQISTLGLSSNREKQIISLTRKLEVLKNGHD